MSAAKLLPARPSLDSLRKQAKKVARDSALSIREAQLRLAHEYGFAGWKDLVAEAEKRLGRGLEWAIAEARRAIHDNDIERLKHLLAEYPALLSWHGDENGGGLLGFATSAYGDAFGEQREQWFTRRASAETLLDAGAVVMPSVVEGLLRSRAVGLLQLFQQRKLLPRTLKFFAALGDIVAVKSTLDKDGNDFETVNEAFVRACGFHHQAVALLLLERLIALDPDLGARIEGSVGRQAFVKYFVEQGTGNALTAGPWKAFVMQQIDRALQDGNLAEFENGLQREPWLLGEAYVDFQNGLLSTAAYVSSAKLDDRGDFIAALLDRNPAILRRQPPPPSQAIEHAITYGHTHFLPMLNRIWPLPDDLPHAAATGNLARVKQWFDASGAAALGTVRAHFPHTSVHQETYDDWGVSPEQKVLDTALAWSVINHHFDVADFLLEHGADINTRWNSHEPASILHHLVFEEDYEAMQYLIDRGIDMAIKDYRWDSNAAGWARYGKSDEKMARWLEDAERRRATRVHAP
ncbi:MAG TPA: ankyrin repeat domain-containing protein [Vicinamibacterales bacterium]|nr:ankyrin repeat domain-containing protein [Vicinamibacterales bacterium]